MRSAVIGLFGALGLAFSTATASATPVIPNPGLQEVTNIVEVAGGCGRGFHPNRWGRCVPHRYGYHGARSWRPHWYGYNGGYGGGYPGWRHRHYYGYGY